MPLKGEAEGNVDAGIHRVAQVIHAVNLDNKNILRVEPVTRPRVHKFEPIASVLEAVARSDLSIKAADQLHLHTQENTE